MLDSLFYSLLDMSLSASVVILVVLAARLALKRVPALFSYLLWAVVFFRLPWNPPLIFSPGCGFWASFS